MRWTYKVRLRFRSLPRKSRAEQELIDELNFHLEKLIEEAIAAGANRRLKLQQFAWIHNALGIEARLDCAHHLQRDWILDPLQKIAL